ncbi:MAG: diguanylate cyclase [Nitrospirae bacterium]|nr:diguanylate cyclase [Nitrospirota bacterium]
MRSMSGIVKTVVSSWYSRLSDNVKVIILSGFAIVILLCLLPTVFSGMALEYSASVLNRFIDVDEKIAELSLTSITKMIKVRRNEKDFLLSYRDWGFNEAKSRYITTSLSLISSLKENMTKIRNLSSNPEIVSMTNEIDRAISDYEAGIMHFVALYGMLGNENTGLEGKFRVVAHEIEDILRQVADDKLIVDLLTMRMREKDYIIQDLDLTFANLLKTAARVKAGINAGKTTPEQKKKLVALIDEYINLFSQYVRTSQNIQTTRQEYLRAIQNVEPTLEKLYFISIDNTFKARNDIRMSEKRIQLTLIFSFLLVLFLSSAMALFVFRKIKSAEERLKVSEKQYRGLFETSPDAITIMDMHCNIIMVNHRASKLLGYANPEEMIGKRCAEIIVPEDQQTAKGMLAKLSEAITVEAVEFRMMKRDGSNIYVESAASIITGAHGKPESIILAARDITARKRAEEQAREAQEYARYLINSSLDMIISVDRERRIVEFNKAAEEIFGYEKHEILGKHIEFLYLDSNESERVSKLLAETGRFAGEVINRKKDHELFPAFLSASTIKDADGNSTGFMGVSRDITEIKKIEEELKAAATLDRLTGVYNRRKFESILDSEIERTRRYKHPLSLIMIDLDHFKNINDAFGHQVGDSVLQTLAVIVKNNIRKTDYFGRWGGEEFMILATETPLEEAFELTEKVRIFIEKYNFEQAGTLTISCGITQFTDQDTPDSLIKRADDALYKAKSSGRNMSVSQI